MLNNLTLSTLHLSAAQLSLPQLTRPMSVVVQPSSDRTSRGPTAPPRILAMMRAACSQGVLLGEPQGGVVLAVSAVIESGIDVEAASGARDKSVSSEGEGSQVACGARSSMRRDSSRWRSKVDLGNGTGVS